MLIKSIDIFIRSNQNYNLLVFKNKFKYTFVKIKLTSENK